MQHSSEKIFHSRKKNLTIENLHLNLNVFVDWSRWIYRILTKIQPNYVFLHSQKKYTFIYLYYILRVVDYIHVRNSEARLWNFLSKFFSWSQWIDTIEKKLDYPTVADLFTSRFDFWEPKFPKLLNSETHDLSRWFQTGSCEWIRFFMLYLVGFARKADLFADIKGE